MIKGTPGETAVDPSCISGDLLNGGALINEMPLFRISLDGLTVKDPVPLFSKYLLRGDQIADNAITTEKIANGTITANDLSNDFVSRITDLEAAWDSVSRCELIASLPQHIDSLVTANVPDLSRYAWLYVVGIGDERPFIIVPYEVLATSKKRLYSTVPGGDAVNFQMVISYNSDISISYRTNKGVKGAEVYGVGIR